MSCEQFRKQICIDPALSDQPMQAHEAECSSCAAYAQRVRKAELLIRSAMRFDFARPSMQATRRTRWGSLAAAIVAGIAVWFGVSVNRPAPTEELVTEILLHWDHEPAALAITRSGVPARELEQVLAGEVTINLAALDRAAIGPVTYANKCAVAGQWMSHLVVQSDKGPVTILLIPEQTVEGIVPLELVGSGLGGSIIPANGGAIAVIGEADSAAAPVARRIADSVNMSI